MKGEAQAAQINLTQTNLKKGTTFEQKALKEEGLRMPSTPSGSKAH